ncbi:MAG TPA: tetraacyldisaccharide 4'-kinase [Patescibacteria group bacterium]|nr:tetraacyldisaccharide 4'-kinase [Patescibacteria group bacterium]
MQLLYNILAVILLLLALPVFAYRLSREKGFGERLRQSFGWLPQETMDKVAGRDAIWLHAASVGEIVATSPIVKEIRRELPGMPVMVSVVTASGYEMARRIIPEADGVIFFPLDLPYLSRSVVRRIRPRVFMLVETELWPNFLKAARHFNIPVMMVNGRISDKSVNRYRYLFGVLRKMLDTVVQYCMQSTVDAQYIIRLGADPRRVVVTGNTKFDQNYTDVSETEKVELFRQLGLSGRSPVIVAGSTHKGEEEQIFAAFTQIRQEFPDVALIVAPREPMRTGDIISLAAEWDLVAVKRTVIKEQPMTGHDIVIIDTIGELGKMYGLGDVIYVGGSLIARGGHNVLEPAAHGKPILVGPHMFNFRDSYALLTGRGACDTVYDSNGLADKVLKLLHDDKARMAMGQAARMIIEENKGAAKKSAQYLRQLLQDRHEPSPPGAVSGGSERFMRRGEALQVYLYKLVHGERHGVADALLLGTLYVFSLIYKAGISIVPALYHWGVLKSHKLPCKVISLGNITVGGTGKTPTAQRLAAIIRDMGYRVVILNRGYRAAWKGRVGLVSDGKKIYMTATEAGDEAYLLAKNLPGVPVVIGKNRSVTGEYAVNRFRAEVIILDDGYQHWELVRDLDIVLVDTINVFGNTYLLPRGTLREPLQHLARANAFLLTKVDQSTNDARGAIRDTLTHYNPQALVVESTHSPQCFIEIENWYKGVRTNPLAVEAIAGRRILAFSAIGNPSSFEQTIASIGAEVVESVRFPDHHDYSMAEMQDVMQKAVDNDVWALITTEKDAVKIPSEFIHSNRPLPVYMLDIKVRFHDGYDELMDLIKTTAQER